MEHVPLKVVLFGLFSLVLFSCEKDSPTGDTPSGKFPGNWGVCYDSARCESVFDNGYMISEKSISQVELSGFENTAHESSECGKCAKTGFTEWTYEVITKDDYTQKGDSISFSPGPGDSVSIKLSGSGKIVTARIHYKAGDEETVITEYWTRLAGTFTPL